jgi:cytidyltransferase-like protein
MINGLSKFLVEAILGEQQSQTIALYPGAFKPPHKGHFAVVKKALEKADKVIIIISPADRGGITAEQSLRIWELYKPLFKGDSNKIEIKISTASSPITETYDIIKSNPQDKFIAIFGKDEAKRFTSLQKADKYSNASVFDAGNIDNISATDFRAAINAGDIDAIYYFLPCDCSLEEFVKIIPVKPLNEDVKNPDIIPGGMAKGKSLQDIVNKHKDWSYEYMKDQLDKGIKVELEHTTSKKVATEIALDHLWEDPQYYIKLAKIEQPVQEADPKVGTGKKPKGSGRRLYTDENPKDTVSIKFKTKEDIATTLNKTSFKSKPHARQSQIINLIHQRVRAAYQNAKDPETKSRLKRGLEYITAKKEASKEKTKRLKNLNEVEISGFTNDINKAMNLIKDETVDPDNKIKAFYPYENVEYIPLLNNVETGKPGTPFSIKGKIRYKDKGENLTADVEVFIGFATMGAGGFALVGKNQDDTFSGKAIIVINADYYNDKNYNTIKSVINHELTHSIDPSLSTKQKKRTGKSIYKATNPEKKAYWNSSVEIIARINELVNPLEDILKLYQEAVENEEITQKEYNNIKRIVLEYITYVLSNEDGKFSTTHINEFISKKNLDSREIFDLLVNTYDNILWGWLISNHISLKTYNPQYPKNIIKGLLSKLKVKELVSEETIEEYKNQETLNPKIWENNKLKIKLREALLKVAQEFYDSLSLDLPLEDILLLGSSANYNWTDASDIDLHLLIDYKSKPYSDLLGKYFDAKKDEFKNKYNLIYQGHPVEVYVQDVNDPNASQGIYSILNNKWIKEPQKENIEIDDFEIAKKAQPLMNQIDTLVSNPETTTIDIDKLKSKIKQFRQAGLDEKGEYSLENLAFKQLRYNGYLEKLNNLKKEKTIKGFELDTLNESMSKTLNQPIIDLTNYASENGYNIEPLPDVKFIDNDIENANDLLGRTAYYDPNNCSITLYTLNRHPKDVLRSYAHELIHHIQNLEDRLQNISTDNINEDEYLKELEREAYEKGNLLLRGWENALKSKPKFQNEYKQYALTELFEKDLSDIKKISPLEYIVGNKDDIEAKYFFRLEIPEKDAWVINWEFTSNNSNQSSEAWKQITATSFKVLDDFIKTKNPKMIYISGDNDVKTNIYKSKSFLEKLETIFNNKYKIDNTPEYSIVMKSIEQVAELSIKKRMETLNESYEQALNYWQNGDLNSNSKIERWNTIKRKMKREILRELYNL